MSGTQPVTDLCPCSAVTFPQAICNPPYQPSIAYRIGDFVAFRYELLQPLLGETELTSWRPGAQGDLAVQMVEWWAYLADILTFYNERIANESYLRTSLLPESLNHLVQILGYRPKPALGAKGTLAALLSSGARPPVTLPQGLQIQSKPGPGESPQVFELDQQTTIQSPDIVTVDVSPGELPLLDASGTTLWLAGKVSGLKSGDRLLLINAQAITTQTIADYAWIKVGGTTTASDPLGNPVTQLSFSIIAGRVAPDAQASAYVLLRGQQSSPLWGYPTDYQVVAWALGGTTTIMLAGLARAVTPGSLVLLDIGDSAAGATSGAVSFATAFNGRLNASAFASAFNGGGPATSDNAYQFCFATAAATAFAAAFSSSAVAAGDGSGAMTAGIAFAGAYAANVASNFSNITSAGFTAAFGASFSASAAAAGAAAAGTAANTLFNTTADCAASFTAGLVAGFAAAGAPLAGNFTAACADFAAAFGSNFVANVGVSGDPASAASTAATGTAATLGTLAPTPVITQSYAETVWYANGNGPTTKGSPPVGLPIAQLGFASLDSTGASATTWNENVSQITVRWGWLPIGTLVPVLTADDYIYPGGGTTLVVDPHSTNSDLPANPAPVLLEDPAGNAAAATMMPVIPAGGSTPAGATLNNITPPPPPLLTLTSPIDMFFNLLGVSRGKTVASEVIGSGNPMVAGQDFTLSQSPVTYFFDTASVSGNNFSSTVKISVNGVQWQEQQSFYGQPANARVFVLHEDDQGKTHATFGDGVNGALLPTGANNITARYRYGAGAATPAAETLTVVQTPAAGLKGVRNPLPPTGGSDADSPSQLRSLAPQSVLTFNRAVSLDDYAAIALTASGVTQAVASFAFDPLAQRPVVTLWIAGDAGAAAAAAAALAGTAIPNQGLRIHQATPVPAVLSLTYVRDPRYDDATVQSSLTTALLDPDTGLLGTNNVGIGQTIYQSQIAAVCLAVPGVTAIQNVVLNDLNGITFLPLRPLLLFRRFPVLLRPVECSGQSFNPGAGKYFSIPNDGLHLQLNGIIAS